MEELLDRHKRFRAMVRLLDGIKKLRQTKNTYALAVCRFVADENENLKDYSRYARIALAADKGETKVVLNYLEGKF